MIIRPLEGVRVLAVEVGAAGPFASRLLADLGADVIKVEPPGGDLARGWDTVARGFSAAHVWLNRNKRSLVLDLKEPKGRELFFELAATADVVLENFKPGVVDELGVGYADVCKVRPDIVYGHISGFGQTGPDSNRKAFDMIIQGEAGLIMMNGSPEAPAKLPLSICDLTAGFYAALGLLAFLRHRDRTGEGMEFEVSMLEAAMSLLGYFPHRYWNNGEEPQRVGLRHHILVPYGPFEARDGRLLQIAILSEPIWRRFCKTVLERPDLLEDARFASNAGRLAHRDVLEPLIAAVFRTRPQDEWLARLDAAEIPCGRINTLAQALAHPQLEAMHTIQELASPAGPVREFVNPVRPMRAKLPFDAVPGLDEHAEQITAEIAAGRAGRAGRPD
jgi:itaconate CoA-transferase